MSQDPLRYFRVEARELVDQISAGVLDLDQQPGPDLVARLLRFAHTLKGAARVVRQQEIADRAHAFEEVLVPHRNGGDPLPADQMRELLRLNDEIEERVAALEPQSPKPSAPRRFPAGMTPGGPSPSPRSRTAADRGEPGAGSDPSRTESGAGVPGAGPLRNAATGPAPGTRAEAGPTGSDTRESTAPQVDTPEAGGGVRDIASDRLVGGPGEGRRPSEVAEATTGRAPRGQSTTTAPAAPVRQEAAGDRGRSAAAPSTGAPEAQSNPATTVRAAEEGGVAADHRPGSAGPPASSPRVPAPPDDSASQPGGGKAASSAPGAAGGPAASSPAADSPAADSSAGVQPTGDRPRGNRPASDRPTADGPACIQPTGDRLAGDGPAGDRPASDRPASDRPAGDRPASDRPAGDQAADDQAAGNGEQGSGAGEQDFDLGHPGATPTGHGSGQAPAKGGETAKGPSPHESTPTARGATADVDDLLDAVGEAHARFAPLRSGGQALDRLTRSVEALADQLRVGRTAAHTDAARVVAARLASDLGALGRRITDTVEQVERELDDVRGRAERLRLVSASSIFTGLHRAVRDAADVQGKRVRFEGRGGDLRLDPQVLALANNALLHVVRNAVAHGIEADGERIAAGKHVEGRVVVEVERRGRFVAFRCTDDGRGFDLAAVRRTAEARGLLMPGGTPPDQQTLVELVLRGGISTSPTVTEVAGRGIGLDVARDVADQLGGDVSVRTTAGRGAVVELVLPLALMSLHGLIVEAAGTVATVPLDAVLTCVRLLPEQAAAAAVTGKLAHDGEAVPFIPLARALYAGTTVPEGGGPAVAVIVGLDGYAVAVGVDRLAGTSTLVVRPLPDLAPAAPVIGGVSMDLDGNPRLVLDAPGLVAETLKLGGGGVAPDEPVRRLPILVVDDSLTTRMLERSILESAGYEVDLAASGEEGLERARSRRYGLYLTDIDMPGIDGFTFVAETRADPELAGVPAILVSSRASAEDRQRGAAVGASAYVIKGEFNQEELLAHIRRLVPA